MTISFFILKGSYQMEESNDPLIFWEKKTCRARKTLWLSELKTCSYY